MSKLRRSFGLFAPYFLKNIHFFGKPTNDFFHLWVSVEYSTPSDISTIKKYGPSAFQLTFERPYSPPRSKVITI